jgi:KipI family sensor histidine kinase inhibitor
VSAPLQIADCGDAAVRVSCRTSDPELAWRTVHALSGWLDARRHQHHLHGAIATYDAVLVEFDAELTDHDAVRGLVELAAAGSGPQQSRDPAHFDIPVVYGGEHGPDLLRVAEQQGLDADEVVTIHTARPLTMRCFGSPAGAPMLDGPHFPNPVPRLTSPRPHVPAGAVAVAGRQAVVSARPAPGGWCVIGSTPRTLIDLSRTPLAPFTPGDTFRFFRITPDEWAAYEGPLDA